jgi:CDP-diacylglycerol---glycerol-3-phosphate 3-phosphatidyltransferase
MPSPLDRLRRQWLATALLWVSSWLVFYALLRPVWLQSGRWLVLSGLVLAYGLRVLWRNLPANHRPGEDRLLPSIGPGNTLSLVRGLCIGLIAGFLFGPWPMGALAWVIVLLYTIADIADYFDGYLARRANHVTLLGGALDIEFDGLGMLVVILLAVSFGQLPVWYLALGLARYLFLFGLWVRHRFERPVYDMTPSAHRRIFAGFQMGFLSVVLWPILPRPMAVISGTLFALATGLGFWRDWLVVSGTIHPAHPTYRRIQQTIYQLFALRLPLLWRALVVICIVSMMSHLLPRLQLAPWYDLLASWEVPIPAFFTISLAFIAILATPLIGLGILPRIMAVAILLPIGFDIATRGLQWDNTVALVCVVFIQLLGAGPYSLWPLEERYLYQRLGE